MKKGRKKITVTIYVTREQDAALKALNRVTKVPTADRVRDGIDLILMANGIDLKMMSLDEGKENADA